ncbi:MAG: ferredoxin [Chitinivibrionales bacterium]|nr:ferredoxin [Chitinivibrionales bacterium]
MNGKNIPGSIEVDKPVKVYVDHTLCKTIGACVQIAPELFKFTPGTKKAVAVMETVPPALLGQCKAAAEACPYNAITIIG